jgi:hypothetical protein
MIIYHSGLTVDAVQAYNKLYPDVKLNAMFSYGRRKRQINNLFLRHREIIGKAMMDSGTFTRFLNEEKFKDVITFEGYLAYLKIFAKKDKVDHYLNFDLDYSREGFETNLRYLNLMEKEGFHPIPVIHDCYNNEEISHYINHGYKYLAIGSKELKCGTIDDLYLIVNEMYQKGIRVHFLGSTIFTKLAYTPVCSCDSSTWAQAGVRKGGQVNYWNPLRSGFDQSDNVFLDYHFLRQYDFLPEFKKYLFEDLGLTIDDLNDKKIRSKTRILNRQVANIHYFTQIEKKINEKHQQLEFIFY